MKVQAFFYPLFLMLVSCPGATPRPTRQAQAVLAGRAPLNVCGTLQIKRGADGAFLFDVPIDHAGRFEAKLGTHWVARDFALVAQGGHCREPAGGQTVGAGRQEVVALVENAGACERREVMVGPYSHLAYVASRSGQTSYQGAWARWPTP